MRIVVGLNGCRAFATLAEFRGAEQEHGGADALLLALQAAGVKEGDEAVTSTFSFFAPSCAK